MDLLLGLSLFGVAFIVTLIVPILGWVRAAQAMNEVRQLRDTHRGARTGAEEARQGTSRSCCRCGAPTFLRSPSR